MRARFLAAAISDGSYLAHVNGAYLLHVKFCIVRGPPLFIVGRYQGWGRLQKPDYDYDYDYSAHKIIDYDYDYDYRGD